MEKNNYLMTRAITDLDAKIATLCHPRSIDSPKPPELKEKKGDHGFSFGIQFAIIGAIISGIIGLLDLFHEGFLTILFLGILILAVYAIIGAVIGFVVGFIIGLIVGTISQNDEKEEAIKKYDIAKELYKKKLDNENIRMANESKQRELLLYQKSKLIEKRRESKKLLGTFYDIVGINERFRNLIPIAYMDEFMRLGIASKLEGVDGLYYLTRKDLREDQMNATLERIVEKLDDIIDNLKEIKEELVDINKKCDLILYETIKVSSAIEKGNKTLKELKDKTEVITYYTERNNRELKYQNFMMTFVNK